MGHLHRVRRTNRTGANAMTIGEYINATGWWGVLFLVSFPIAQWQVLNWLADFLYPIEDDT